MGMEMGRKVGGTIGKLSALRVATLIRKHVAGMHNDGGGLYLQISPGAGASWVFRYKLNGRRTARDMGLGPAHTVTLAEARDKALQCRKLRLADIDPIEQRKAERLKKRLEAVRSMTFRQCAEAYISAHLEDWRSARHAAQWPASLAIHVYPMIGDLPVRLIDTDLIMKVLTPIWSTKRETASRVRGRIERILEWATVSKFRRGDNPARWNGHLEELLSNKRGAIQHLAALPYTEIAAFIEELRRREGVAARALEFLILTAARTGEVIGATWGEIDLTERLWVIPSGRMKAGKEHRVPLSDSAMAVLGRMSKIRENEYVFPGGRTGRPLSMTALLRVLRDMDRGVTAHGFRSSFSDWAAERTNFPAEVRQMALAHVVGDKVEAAYRRGDLFRKRRQLSEAWARFCATPTPQCSLKIVPIRADAE
jgi:integrase